LAPGLEYRTALGTAYGAGLRVSEVAALKVADIDSTRTLIWVKRNGRKDRNAMLSKGVAAFRALRPKPASLVSATLAAKRMSGVQYRCAKADGQHSTRIIPAALSTDVRPSASSD
jgi:integrase